MSFKFPAGVLAQHIIALGKTGSGKSSKLRVLVEGLLDDDKPVCIIDPKGDWWGLKSSADSKHAGYPIVIFGGEHADVPINERSGAQVAELIATGNRSCLIDLGGWMVGERTRFFVDFASSLFKHARGARHLVIDEVHNFAPQGKVLNPDAGKMLHWANRLASEGRGKGITIIAASQRPQKVHKDFVTSCETLIACKVIHVLDRNAVKDWVDGCADPAKGKEVIGSLAQLKKPQAWVWCPEIDYGPVLVDFPLFKTYDSFKPQQATQGKLKGWADVDLDEVKSKLATVVAEAEANDPAALKKQIAELQRQIKATPAPAEIDPKQWKEDVVQSHKEGFTAGQQSIVDQLEVYYGSLEDWREDMPPPPVFKFAADLPRPKFSQPKVVGITRAVSTPVKIPVVTGSKPHNGDARISRPQQVILDQLAILKDREIYPASRATLAAFCKVSPSSSGYEKNLSTLKTLGMIEYPRQGEVAFTHEGEAAAAAPFDDGTPAADFWLQIVNEPKAKILRVLITEHPTAMSRGAIAQKADVSESSSGFEKNLSQLKTLGAIEYPMSGVVALTRYVMP